MQLSRLPDYAFDLNTGAADVELDLRDFKASRVDLDIGASSVNITLPGGGGTTEVRVNGGASSVKLTVPAGVAARVRSQSGLSSLSVDMTRFPKSGDYYVSPDYNTAANRVDIELHTGASSISVK